MRKYSDFFYICPKISFKMRKIAFLLLFFQHILFAQNLKYTLSGKITEENTGESVIGASIYISELGLGAVTNNYGFYSLTLPAGTYTVKISFVGLQNIEKTVDLSSS